MDSIRLEGMEEVSRAIKNIGDLNELDRALGKCCAIVERAAKQKAPKGNGDLRRSITSKVENSGDEIIGTVFTPLEYAPYRYVRSLNRAKSGKPKQLKYQTI